MHLPYRYAIDTDPEDLSQQPDDLGGFHIEAPLAVVEEPGAEASEDLDVAAAAEHVAGGAAELEAELDEGEAAIDPDAEVRGIEARDTGELYGVRTPRAGDTDLAAPEDLDSFEGSWRGETWLESLQEHAAAMGPAPEEEVVIVDDSEVGPPRHRGHHATERDRPVADKGSGGPGGL